MDKYDAVVRPHQPWGANGTADVFKIETGGKMTLLGTFPLIHAADTSIPPNDKYPVARAQRPDGLLIINMKKLPTEPQETITIGEDNTNQIIVPCHGWPNGHGGARFI